MGINLDIFFCLFQSVRRKLITLAVIDQRNKKLIRGKYQDKCFFGASSSIGSNASRLIRILFDNAFFRLFIAS